MEMGALVSQPFCTIHKGFSLILKVFDRRNKSLLYVYVVQVLNNIFHDTLLSFNLRLGSVLFKKNVEKINRISEYI